MTVGRTRSPYGTYKARPPSRPGRQVQETLGNVRTHGESVVELLSACFSMLEDHASHIETLKTEQQETNDFLKWVSETHVEAFSEYKAVKDLAAVGGNSTLHAMLAQWGDEK